MNLWPIVQRELRVAARQRGTYGVRVAAAFGAVAIVTMARGMLEATGAAGGTGRSLFYGLVGLAGLAGALSGTRLTADAISREKREGTLGLLFLSRLSGMEVALGKLLAHSTRAFYALLATFPVLAIPYLAGGVTGGELGLALLGLANTLFFASSLGLLVSSMTLRASTALTLATVGMLVFWFALPAVAAILLASGPGAAAWGTTLACLTPASAVGFAAAAGITSGHAWLTLLATQVLAWCLLGLAAWITGRVWRERPAGRPGPGWTVWWHPRSHARGADRPPARRTAVLEQNPFLWLLVRVRWKPVGPGLFVLAVLAAMALAWRHGGGADGDALLWAAYLPGCFFLHLILKFWIAGETVAPWAAHRREGTLELLLTTPLAETELVQAQLRAIRWQFGLPLALTALATLGGAVAWTATYGGEESGWFLAGAAGATLALGADALVLVWVGTWRGVTARRENHAAGGTAFRVLVAPWLIYLALTPFTFTVVYEGPAVALLVWAWIGFGWDYFWWRWARQEVPRRLRAEAARAWERARPDWLDRLAGR